MDTYCLVCKKKTGNVEATASRTKKGQIMILSKCAVCGKKKSRFVKKEEASGILSSLWIKTPLSKVSLLNVLF